MLLPTMNAEEIYKELKRDSLYILDKFDGLNKKYRRACQMSRKDGIKFLGKHTYRTKYGNEWTVNASAVFRELELAMGIALRGNYGTAYYQLTIPEGLGYRDYVVLIYTPHFFDRLKERVGRTADEYFANYVGLQVGAEPKSNSLYLSDAHGVGLGRRMQGNAQVYRVNTYITHDMLYEEQKVFAYNGVRESGLTEDEYLRLMNTIKKIE